MYIYTYMLYIGLTLTPTAVVEKASSFPTTGSTRSVLTQPCLSLCVRLRMSPRPTLLLRSLREAPSGMFIHY